MDSTKDTTQNLQQGSWWQLMPFVFFIGLFLLLHLVFRSAEPESKMGFAHFSAIISIVLSFFIFPYEMKFNERMAVFVQGAAQPTVIHMSYIFVISSVFTYFITKNGGIDAAVHIGMYIIPPYAIIPGLFVTVSLFALIVGTSMGTIAAFTPIALGFAHKLSIEPALMASIVVSGAMLGDNLSLISDTTIAATETIHCKPSDKFKENGTLVLVASIITIILLTIINVTQYYTPSTIFISSAFVIKDLVNIMPYFLVFILALMGLDVLIVLTLSTFIAVLIGLWQQSYTFLQATTYTFEGFYSQPDVVNVLILIILIIGLAHIVEKNGGIHYLLTKWEHKITSRRKAEFSLAIITFLITAAIAINTISILIVGPVARKIGIKFGIPNGRVASIIDTFSCICQGILPYSAQVLLASAIAHTSTASILPHLHYQYIILAISLISIWWKTRKKRK